MENMDYFEEKIDMVCRNLRYFHYYGDCMKGLMVNLYWVERTDAS